jgi:hypothetical protein
VRGRAVWERERGREPCARCERESSGCEREG